MKHFTLLRAAVIAALVSMAAVSIATTQLAANSPTQQKLDQYLTGSIPESAAERVLDELRAIGLSGSDKNIAKLRERLTTKISDGQKLRIVRVLGDLHSGGRMQKTDAEIERDIKALVYQSNKEVAHAALQTYARLNYLPDRQELLDYGYQNQLITADEYSQEMALGLPIAPAEAQSGIAARIQAVRNPFGAKVLAWTLRDAPARKSLTPESRKIALEALKQNEPVVQFALSHFGYGEGLEYANWLHTVASLNEELGKQSYLDTVTIALDSPATDPRKVMGFLTSRAGEEALQKYGANAFKPSGERAIAFALQFPDHPVMTPMAEEIGMAIGKKR
jgi:hypothetical protein